MRVQLPPLPPSLPGRPLRSRRQSEKLDKHVRLVSLAPDVTVAEWLRRATVDRSTRVQFSPVTPFSVTPFLLGGSQVGKASDFESDHAEVRILPSQPRSCFTRASFNGSGYPATNRETWRFKSSRPRHFPARRPRDRAQPSEGWNSGSTPDGPANILRSVDRLARYPAVYRVEASSILVRSAKFFEAMWTSWLSRPSFKRVIAGSNPAIATISLA